MKTTKLSFNQLNEELEVLQRSNLQAFKGGSDIQWGEDADGNIYWRDGENGAWNRYVVQLDTVVINGTAPQSLAPSYNDYNNYLFGGGNTYGLYGGNGYYGDGSSSSTNETNYVLNEKFNNLLSAVGTTASAFGGVTGDIHSLSKLGDFADEARSLLKNMSKYSGAIGTALDVILTGVEMLQDGKVTVSEVSAFIADQIVGGFIGAIPFAGGVLSTVYDLTGGDDYVKDQIKELINKYYGDPSQPQSWIN